MNGLMKLMPKKEIDAHSKGKYWLRDVSEKKQSLRSSSKGSRSSSSKSGRSKSSKSLWETKLSKEKEIEDKIKVAKLMVEA